MRSAKSIGRVVGGLLPVQMALGLILQFVLIQEPLSIAPPGFLITASANAAQIRIAVGLAFVGGALTVSIAILAWPVFRRYSPTMALWFLIICAISFVMDAIHNATVMSMLSMSDRFVATEAPNMELYQALAAAARSLRYWAHYVQLAFIGGWIFLFYTILLRFALIPRALAILGLVGILLQFAGVTLPAFSGYPGIAQLAMPLAPIHFATGVWLIFKGFRGESLHVQT